MDDDVVLRMAEGWPERVYFGKPAACSFFDGWAETVGQETVIEEATDAGAVVVVRQRVHLLASMVALILPVYRRAALRVAEIASWLIPAWLVMGAMVLGATSFALDHAD
jgi:hypothetical protein